MKDIDHDQINLNDNDSENANNAVDGDDNPALQ